VSADLLAPLKALRDGRPLGAQDDYLDDLLGRKLATPSQ